MEIDEVINNVTKVRDYANHGIVYSILDDAINQILDIQSVTEMNGNQDE